MTEGRLVASSNRGRYAIGSEDGPDLTSGMSCEIQIGGQWIAGRVESGPFLYASNMWIEQRLLRGYYFISDAGEICGLCVGMSVRLV